MPSAGGPQGGSAGRDEGIEFYEGLTERRADFAEAFPGVEVEEA